MIVALLAVIAGVATILPARRASALEPPPPPPWRRGPDVDGTIGVYAPLGRLKRVSSVAPWARLTGGYDLAPWIGLFVGFDSTFLSTNRASPPPGERGYVLWGFSGGARLSLPLGPRWRIPLRLELGAHKADDAGVLASYGFPDARSFGLSYGAMLGLEYRAPSRHFGVATEWGVRRDAALQDETRSAAPLALVGGVLVRYTL